MIDLSKICSYNVACGYTDLRLGIDGFAAVVTQQFADHLDGTSASNMMKNFTSNNAIRNHTGNAIITILS